MVNIYDQRESILNELLDLRCSKLDKDVRSLLTRTEQTQEFFTVGRYAPRRSGKTRTIDWLAIELALRDFNALVVTLSHTMRKSYELVSPLNVAVKNAIKRPEWFNPQDYADFVLFDECTPTLPWLGKVHFAIGTPGAHYYNAHYYNAR